jgi:hypothetical protein
MNGLKHLIELKQCVEHPGDERRIIDEKEIYYLKSFIEVYT